MKRFLALLFFVPVAHAQVQLDSWSNLIDSKVVRTFTAAPLTSAGPLTALTMPLAQNMLVTTVTFPASSTPYTFSGVRVSVTMTGTGWKPVSATPYQLDVPYPPFAVPSGVTVIATYTATLSGMANLLAVLGPLPPPPQPSTLTPNKVGDSVPPLTQLVDQNLAVWTLVGTKVLMGTKDMTFYSDTNRLYISSGGFITVFSPTHGYACWKATTWFGSGC